MKSTKRFATLSLSLALLASAFTLAAGAAPQTTAKAKGSAAKPAAAAKAPAAGLLDGQTFAGELDSHPAKGKAETAEKGELSFAAGQFHALVADAHGFKMSSYTANQDGKLIRFNSVLTSPTDGKMIWKGKVTGKEINAEVRWEKTSGSPVELHYKGAVKS